MAARKSLSIARSWAMSRRLGAPASNGCDQREVVYMTGGWADDMSGEMFQISAPWTRNNSSGLTKSALLRRMRVWYSRPFNWSKIASVSGPTSNLDGS